MELSPNPNATATNAIGPFLLGLLNSLTVPSRLFIGLGAGVALFLYQFLFLAPIIVVVCAIGAYAGEIHPRSIARAMQ